LLRLSRVTRESWVQQVVLTERRALHGEEYWNWGHQNLPIIYFGFIFIKLLWSQIRNKKRLKQVDETNSVLEITRREGVIILIPIPIPIPLPIPLPIPITRIWKQNNGSYSWSWANINVWGICGSRGKSSWFKHCNINHVYLT
jgi:hypothetical protein